MGRATINRSIRTRHIALLLCILYVAASLTGAAFILTHANHEHDRNGPSGSCATCTHVMAVSNLLKTLGIAAVSAALCLGMHQVIIATLKPIGSNSVSHTLISLKVELNH